MGKLVRQMLVSDAVSFAAEKYGAVLSALTIRNWCTNYGVGHKIGSAWFVYEDRFLAHLDKVAKSWTDAGSHTKPVPDGVSVLSVKEACAMAAEAGIKLSPYFVKSWCKTKNIGTFFGGEWRVYEDNFVDFLNGAESVVVEGQEESVEVETSVEELE